MERESLVSINILNSENKLLNKTCVPMLYYWNGNTDVLDDLSNDEELINYSKGLFNEPTDYLKINISYFYFKYDENHEEEYSDNTIPIQNIVTLDKFDSDYIVLHYLHKHFSTLYKNSFKTTFVSETFEPIENIITMYRDIKSKFKTRLNKITIVNWVRSVLIDTEHFNSVNSDYIIFKLNEILKLEE